MIIHFRPAWSPLFRAAEMISAHALRTSDIAAGRGNLFQTDETAGCVGCSDENLRIYISTERPCGAFRQFPGHNSFEVTVALQLAG